MVDDDSTQEVDESAVVDIDLPEVDDSSVVDITQESAEAALIDNESSQSTNNVSVIEDTTILDDKAAEEVEFISEFDEPTMVDDEPAYTLDDPAKVDDEPVVVDDLSTEKVEDFSVFDKPTMVDDEPAHKVDDPVAGYELATTTDEPLAVNELAVVADEPVVVNEPAVVVDEPVVADKPVVVDEPVVDEPVVVVEDPTMVDDEPAQNIDEPALVDDSSQKADETSIYDNDAAQSTDEFVAADFDFTPNVDEPSVLANIDDIAFTPEPSVSLVDSSTSILDDDVAQEAGGLSVSAVESTQSVEKPSVAYDDATHDADEPSVLANIDNIAFTPEPSVSLVESSASLLDDDFVHSADEPSLINDDAPRDGDEPSMVFDEEPSVVDDKPSVNDGDFTKDLLNVEDAGALKTPTPTAAVEANEAVPMSVDSVSQQESFMRMDSALSNYGESRHSDAHSSFDEEAASHSEQRHSDARESFDEDAAQSEQRHSDVRESFDNGEDATEDDEEEEEDVVAESFVSNAESDSALGAAAAADEYVSFSSIDMGKSHTADRDGGGDHIAEASDNSSPSMFGVDTPEVVVQSGTSAASTMDEIDLAANDEQLFVSADAGAHAPCLSALSASRSHNLSTL